MNALHIDEDGLEISTTANTRIALVHLNLRGTVFSVPDNCADKFPDSRLSKALHGNLVPSPLKDENGNLFFNSNPTIFHDVLDTIRNGSANYEDCTLFHRRQLANELQYWGISSKRVRDSENSGSVDYGEMKVIPPPMRQNDLNALHRHSGIGN